MVTAAQNDFRKAAKEILANWNEWLAKSSQLPDGHYTITVEQNGPIGVYMVIPDDDGFFVVDTDGSIYLLSEGMFSSPISRHSIKVGDVIEMMVVTKENNDPSTWNSHPVYREIHAEILNR